MNKLFIIPAVTALSACIMQSSMAIDGTITFSGSVTDVTCTVNVAGGSSASTTVTLPSVSRTSLASAATTSGDTPFSIALSGCTGTGVTAAAKNVAVYFEPGTTVNPAGRLTSTGTASNVDIALYLASAPTTQLVLGRAPTTGYDTLSTTKTTATMNFLAKYYATGAAGTGTVLSSVTYSVVYP